MREHKCNKIRQFWSIKHYGNKWNLEWRAKYTSDEIVVNVIYCPFCGEKLPEIYEDGFYVVENIEHKHRRFAVNHTKEDEWRIYSEQLFYQCCYGGKEFLSKWKVIRKINLED